MASTGERNVGSIVRVGITVAVLIGAVYLLLQAVGQPNTEGLEEALQAGGELTGAEMPYDWSVEALDGQMLNVADLKGKPIFVNIWATWCPPCRAELPSIQRLYDAVKDEGVAFLLISNETRDQIGGFAESQGLNLPFCRSVQGVPSVFDTRGIPATFIVSPGGQVVMKQVGAYEWDEPRVAELLRRLAAEGS